MTLISEIRRKSGMVLVEWSDGEDLKRAWILPDMIVDGQVEEPEMGVPYGDSWQEIIEADPDNVIRAERELYRRGIWNISDARSNPQTVSDCVADIPDISVASILGAIQRYEKGDSTK